MPAVQPQLWRTLPGVPWKGWITLPTQAFCWHLVFKKYLEQPSWEESSTLLPKEYMKIVSLLLEKKDARLREVTQFVPKYRTHCSFTHWLLFISRTEARYSNNQLPWLVLTLGWALEIDPSNESSSMAGRVHLCMLEDTVEWLLLSASRLCERKVDVRN